MVKHSEHSHQNADAEKNLRRDDRFYQAVHKEIVQWLAVAPGSLVLDAGCGTGGFTELLAGAVGRKGKVTALDVKPEFIEATREHLSSSPYRSRVTCQEGDATALPFPAQQFDLVWCSRMVHHLPDQLAGVRELYRVLRPGGRLALREGGLRPRFLPADIGLGEPGLEDRLNAHFQRWFATNVRSSDGAVPYPFGWTQLLRDAGFTNVSGKTFLLEGFPPFSADQVDFLAHQLSMWTENPERRALLSSSDDKVIQKLLDPTSPHYAFTRSDLHLLAGVSVYLGKA